METKYIFDYVSLNIGDKTFKRGNISYKPQNLSDE